MNSELKSIQQFFTERRKRCLSVKSIEIEAKLPAKTLAHFLKGRRLLNSEHLDTLIPVLVDFGYKPVASESVAGTCSICRFADREKDMCAKARILGELQLEAKEAELESEKIGNTDREGGFQEWGRQQGLERAMEIVSKYVS